MRVRHRTGEHLRPKFVRPRHTGPTPGVMVRSAISNNARSSLMFEERSLISARYIQHVMRPVLIPFLQREGVHCHATRSPRCSSTALAGTRAGFVPDRAYMGHDGPRPGPCCDSPNTSAYFMLRRSRRGTVYRRTLFAICTVG